MNRVLSKPLHTSDVIGAYAGLRALAIQPGASPSENTREYRFHQDPWAANLITVCGGKLTTSRSLGEKLVDQVVASLPSDLIDCGMTRRTNISILPSRFTPTIF